MLPDFPVSANPKSGMNGWEEKVSPSPRFRQVWFGPMADVSEHFIGSFFGTAGLFANFFLGAI
jgi:hypothetical protein